MVQEGPPSWALEPGEPNPTHGAFGTEELSVCLEKYVCFSKKDKGIDQLEREVNDQLRNKPVSLLLPGIRAGVQALGGRRLLICT